MLVVRTLAPFAAQSTHPAAPSRSDAIITLLPFLSRLLASSYVHPTMSCRSFEASRFTVSYLLRRAPSCVFLFLRSFRLAHVHTYLRVGQNLFFPLLWSLSRRDPFTRPQPRAVSRASRADGMCLRADAAKGLARFLPSGIVRRICEIKRRPVLFAFVCINLF